MTRIDTIDSTTCHLGELHTTDETIDYPSPIEILDEDDARKSGYLENIELTANYTTCTACGALIAYDRKDIPALHRVAYRSGYISFPNRHVRTHRFDKYNNAQFTFTDGITTDNNCTPLH